MLGPISARFESAAKLAGFLGHLIIFHKGKLKESSFSIGGDGLEIVSQFTYLGFLLTPQLSFTKHLQSLNTKARSRIGYMFHHLPIRDVSMNMAMGLFKIYILPIYQYGLPIWSMRHSKSVTSELNAVFTKYLKRYLGVPRHFSNHITHFLTETTPFFTFLQKRIQDSITCVRFPTEFSGIMLSIFNGRATEDYNCLEQVPSWFWLSQSFHQLPSNPKHRRRLCMDIFDSKHSNFCQKDIFHIPDEACVCKYCNDICTHYHARFCSMITMIPQ